MPRFQTVMVYPQATWWGHAWVEDDADGDAFARVARGICDAYSAELFEADLHHTVSSLVIYIDSHSRVVPAGSDRTQTVVLSPNGTDRVFEGYEAAAVRVGAGFAMLPVNEQRRVALEAVHAAAEGLARFRVMDLAAFERARVAVVEAGYVFRWASDWKSSPGRRWRARCCFHTKEDGYGRLVVEISTPDGTVTTTSTEQLAHTTIGDFVRAAKTLRWIGRDRINVLPWTDRLLHGGAFSVDVAAPSSSELHLTEVEVMGPPSNLDAEDLMNFDRSRLDDVDVDGDRPTPAPPPVLLVIPDPNEREIVTVGGGPTNYVPEQYWRTLHALFEQLRGPAWQQWWAPAELPKLEIWWRADPDGQDRLVVRRSKNKVIARIERTGAGQLAVDPVHAAREDVAGLMEAVQHRMSLGTPPTLH